MTEQAFKFILNAVLFGLAYWTTKLLLPLCSAGRWRVDMQRSGLSYWTHWPVWTRDADGTTYLGPQGAVFLGILIWVAAFMGLGIVLLAIYPSPV